MTNNMLIANNADHSVYYKRITSKHRFFSFNLAELNRYRDLVLLLTKKTLSVTYKQTILGPIWLFITPIITSLIHTLVFGSIAKINTDGIPALLFYFFSTAIWSLFSNCLTNCSETFTSSVHLLSKVYFPRLVMPVSIVLSSIIKFLLQLIPAMILYVYYLSTGFVSFSFARFLLFPISIMLVALLGMGFGLIVSALTIKYRDLHVLIKFGVSIWMYISPVVYPLSAVSVRLQQIMSINPVTFPIELMRYSLWSASTITFSSMAISLVVSITVLLLGVMLFNHVERTFADTV